MLQEPKPVITLQELTNNESYPIIKGPPDSEKSQLDQTNTGDNSECVAYDFLDEKGQHSGYFRMDPFTGVPELTEFIEESWESWSHPGLHCPMISCEGAEDSTCYGRISPTSLGFKTDNINFPGLWQELVCYGCETAKECFAAANAIGRSSFMNAIGTETCYYFIQN